MSIENIHLALLNSLDNPKVVKKMLENPRISVSYSIRQNAVEGKTLKIVTPILVVFSQILMITLYPGGDLKKLKNFLESARLMTRHRTYKESLKYEFESVATQYINSTLNFSGTKYGETYKSLMESGFTLKSFANNNKLTNALMEDKAFFGKKSVAQKESMKKTLKEVKLILNKTNLPIWAIILFTVVAILILAGGGFYGRKRYLRRRRSLRNYKKNMENYMKKLNKRKFISSSQYVAGLKGKY